MNRHRFAISLAASVLVLATGAGCSDDRSTPGATPGTPDAGDSSPGPATTSSEPVTSPLEGEWSASISAAAAKSTLRAAGMGELISRVVTCPKCLPSPEWDLRIAGDEWLLFNEGEVIDDGAITIDGHQVVIENADVPGQVVLRFEVEETTLHLSFVSQSRPEIEPGLNEEPIIRMLYTTAPWTRAS